MNSKFRKVTAIGAVLAAFAGAAPIPAQTVSDNATPAASLDLPANLQIFGKVDPNVRKATAIVNDNVITGTDVDQRVALVTAANQLNLSAEDKDRLKLQILRSLIDETLQIQEAKNNDVKITPEQINQAFARVSSNFGRTPADMRTYLRSVGSSERSLKRQIEAELAWSGFLRRRVEPLANVGNEEVQGILDRMKASQGTEEYHLKEIYVSGSADRTQQAYTSLQQMIQEIQKGTKPFEYYAQYSEATTRGTQGDLGWVGSAQLGALPASLAEAARTMNVGQLAGPIEVPGGFSLLYLVDKRKVLEADPRDAKLSLKQISVKFAAGLTQADANARVAAFAKQLKEIHGCGAVAGAATAMGAEVVDNDAVKVRDLPAQLQEIMLKLQVGEATPAFGSQQDGVRALVLCGRDDPKGAVALPTVDQVRDQMEQQKVNRRAQQMLRDLRRDAVVEYR
ncbi:peptidylprolyl isomerase [Sphingomonas sp. CA1-15]|uniref:Parvulin-like PPIase n=1 Tax=Sphingomonas immobilis TaxID=3063997 RepID=A0ABT8ZYU4_9SPHN|nr:peptidylprolyl isomerase [Sphingomonas sp. CA1-15]MDO7842746.1 peptidylprolyl isomerase [Sphingomonas sp. CA1-15]